MVDNSAVPHILLVDEKFHRLNNVLKSFHRQNASKAEWEEKAREMRLHLDSFMHEVVEANFLHEFGPDELPKGRLNQKLPVLSEYRRDKRLGGSGFNTFRAGDTIKRRLVCYWCVRKWYELSEGVTDQQWSSRTEGNFLHIFGKKDNSGRTYLGLDKRLHAVHPRRETDDNGGSRCQGINGVTKHPGDLAIGLSQVGQSLVPSYRILIKNLPDDNAYKIIREEITETQDYGFGNANLARKTVKFEKNYDGFIDLSSLNQTTIANLQQRLQFNVNKFKNSNAVILEGLCIDSAADKIDIMYLPQKFSGNHTYSFANSIQPLELGMGLFLFTRGGQPVTDDSYFQYMSAEGLESGLKRAFQWNNDGKLYRFRPEGFLDFNEENMQSKIDLSEWRTDSEVLANLEAAYPQTKFPTIRTTLRTITVYSTRGEQEENKEVFQVKNSQTFDRMSSKYLFKLHGFNLKSVVGIIVLRSHESDGREVVRWEKNLEPNDFRNGAIVLNIPENLVYTSPLSLSLWVKDKYSQTTTIRFRKNSSLRKQFSGFEDDQITLEQNEERILEFFAKQIKFELGRNLQLNSTQLQERFFHKDSLIYSEVLKQKMVQEGLEPFSLIGKKYNRLDHKYLGLDLFCFGRENLREDSFGNRLRATGLFEPRKENKWVGYDHHIVKLDQEWNLLLTRQPLHTYGLSTNDDRLLVTNHGIFFNKEATIPEFNHIPVRAKPMFLHHIANNPESHLQFIVTLIDHFDSHHEPRKFDEFVVTYSLNPTSQTPILGVPLTSHFPSNNHWERLSIPKSVTSAPQRFFLTHDSELDVLTCLDIVLVQNQTKTESQLVIRRHHQSGRIQLLPLVRILDEGDRQVRYRPEWWTALDNLEDENLKELSNVVGSHYKKYNRTSSHDWDFLVRDTLRAFHLVEHQELISKFTDITDIKTLRSRLSWHWPDPLRRYLMGGGVYNRNENRNTDALGGLLDEISELDIPSLSNAIIQSVLRWLWIE